MPFEIPSYESMRRAVEQEMEASRRVLTLVVSSARWDGELVRCDLNDERDLTGLEDGMEGGLASWSSQGWQGINTTNGGGIVKRLQVRLQ